jgi:long-chain fatty acid transport protein
VTVATGLRSKASLTVAACLGLAALAGRARAAGFASAEFGGEQGNVVTTNPTALYFNPAGIGFSEGTNFYVGGVLAWRRGTWTHPPVATEMDPPGAEGADSGEARFSNLFGGPALGATTRIGRFAAGAAFYVPFGGRIHWDQNQRFVGDPNFPLAADGVQRWTTIEGALTYLYFTVGAAVRIGRLSLGLTGNLVHSSIQNTQAFNTQHTVDPSNEGRSTVDVSGIDASFGAGAMLEAVPDRLWLAASYQAQPGLGAIKLNGTLDLTMQGGTLHSRVDYFQALPDIVRLGARFRPTARTGAGALELRLYGDLTRWSRLQTECVSVAGSPCLVFASGADATPNASVVQNLRRFWNDSYGVHAGASYWLRPALELYAGAGFETAAAPASTLDPVLPDAASVRLAAGVRVDLGRGWHVSGTLTDVQFFSRDNTGQSMLENAEPPTRRQDGGGRYTLWLGLFQIAVEKQL